MHSITFSAHTPDTLQPVLTDCRIYRNAPDAPDGSVLRPRVTECFELEIVTAPHSQVLHGQTRFSCRAGDILFRFPDTETCALAPHSSILIFFTLAGVCPGEPVDFFRRLSPHCRPEPAEASILMSETILRAHIQPDYASPLLVRATLLQLLHRVFVTGAGWQSGVIPENALYDSRLHRVVTHMHQHFSEKGSLNSLSAIAGLSPGYFHTLFVRTFGRSPGDYLQTVRLEKAREFLLTTALPIQQVGDRCGFENASHFSETFRRFTGMSPREFRKRFSL